MFFNVIMNVSLLIFVGIMNEIGGDIFVLLLNLCVVIGVIFVLIIFFVKCFIDSFIMLKLVFFLKIVFVLGLFMVFNGILVVFVSLFD